MPALGHGRGCMELVPRIIEVLVGNQVIGAAAGGKHTAVWTDAGELLTLGLDNMGIWATEGQRMSM